MKKHLFYASLFVAALSSCSKDDDRVSAPAGEVNNDLELIKLSVSGAEAFNVQTRGTGVVGGFAENNNWNGQTLYVLMTDSGSVNKVVKANAGYAYDNMPEEILWNVAVTAPASENTGLIAGGELQPHFYYPVAGNYDFYGYHVDDAVTNPEPEVSGNDLVLNNVEIDGSQDLLVAKADWNTDLQTAETQYNFNDLSWYPNAEGYKYGAYAARRAVQPTLTFEHLLTQLQFTVENKSKDYDITVKSITVNSKSTANVTVAGENFGFVEWQKDENGYIVADLAVKSEDGADDDKLLDEFSPVTLNKVDSEAQDAAQSKKIGNLLVAASVVNEAGDGLITEYKGEITLEQTLDATLVNESLGENVVVTQTVPFTIALPATNVHPNFLAGHAYEVKIYVYGLSLIKVTADLTAWQNGGHFEVTPEDQVNTGEDAKYTPTTDDMQAALAFESTKLYNTLTSAEKEFGEKVDTLLAYLASGYSIGQVTRGELTCAYEATTYGEIDFSPYADAEGNVTIESTLTAKNEYTANIANGWVVCDYKTWEMLPSSYRNSDHVGGVYPTNNDMPWLAVTFSGLEGKAKVTTPSGVTVEVFEINTNNTLVTVSAEELKEVNSELPDAFENGVYTIAIGDKEWKIEYKAQ